ncbi:MAG TPA: TonB family protein, partial [Candidatus Saccharimonadales bacterium]|nr:TonB family protein [Candidatus Saccharimonadales bacterium]
PHLVPPMIPRISIPPSSTLPTDGEIVLTNRVDPIDPNVIEYRPFDPGTGVGPEPNPGGAVRTDGSGRFPPPPPETTHAFKVVETPPVPIYAPLPVYPDFAREAGIEGRVIVRVLVGTDGLPKRVVAISGPKLLFAAAEDGVRRWRFNPGMSAGEPLQVSVDVPVVFTLQ